MLDLSRLTQEKNYISDAVLHRIASAIAAITILVATLVALLSHSKTEGWTVWLQIGVALLVLGFSLAGESLSASGKMTARQWQFAALIVGLIVFIASFYCGLHINFLLAPLVVGAGHHRGNSRVVVFLSLVVAGILLLQFLILGLLDWQYNYDDNQGAIAAIISLCGLGLSLSNFLRNHLEVVENYRQEAESKASEMEVAHEIQTSLMPPSEIVTGEWNMVARSIPARDVGGDFYEYIPYLDKGIGGIAIGDVAGKGIPAALQMAVVRTVFRIEARRRIFPAETLSSVNMALQAERSFGMVTMLYAFIDPATSTLHVANAGHNFPIIMNGKLEEIRLSGLPLGIDDSVEYEEQQMKIAPGTSVIFYTDGVPEAMDPQGEMYGFDRFKEALLRTQHLESREMIDEIFKEISTFTKGAPQSDDITVMVVQNNRIKTTDDDPDHNREVDLMFASVNAGSTNNNDEAFAGFDDDNINWI